MARAFLIVDIQRDYFPGGRNPLVEPDAAADAAARVLASFRQAGEPIVHLQHVWDADDAAFFKPGTPGVEIDPRVAPAEGEPLLQKAEPNGFLGTALEQTLRDRGVDQLVVAGMMSSMCVDATVRAAADLGFAVTVVHDACAALDLAFAGNTIPGRSVHGAFMAALGSSYATLVSAKEVTGG